MQVESWLERAARTRPHGPAVNALDAGALLDRARRADLQGAGPGDRVGIALPPGTDFAVALHATWLRGAIAVPHDLRLQPHERPPADVVVDAVDLLDPARAVPPGARHDLDAVAVALQTSGSTGRPKPVELTFRNLLFSALGSAALLGVAPGDRWLSALPPSHVGGLSVLVRSAIYGTAATILERWDTERVAHELQAGRASLVSVVPTTLARLLDGGLDRPPALRHALLGGAPIAGHLLERATAAGIRVAPTYGLTEAASQVTTFGVPLFCTRVGLEADGEITVRGLTVAPGSGPVLHTGDLGRLTADGRLELIGRKADTIVTGGENVAPAEVEGVLERHPAVEEAGVHGREDPEWGEAVVAVVVLREGRRADARELQDHCAAHLARFKVPKDVRFAAALPRTGSGKLQRAGLPSVR
ncbi:class I adenylate-forming enzyme family protein [Conexibacter sp. SYSU D00693]|uniref:class I adenylate-forming enzyme family protein n=1 Tax=Conexibacter sp. SYSU D00693 TaxID=2812560 RepID=UPI00196ADD85|nr:AMP-binding protein [Conexibacter sp. SYSU D00693]